MNIKARRDYIDTFYVDGIKDDNGNTVIRALEPSEKEWLDKFYSEHVNASFCETNTLHDVRSKEDRVKIKERVKILKKERQVLQKDINKAITEMNAMELNNLELNKEIRRIDDELTMLVAEDQKKQCTDANNARNRCLYNQAKKTGKLVKLNYRDYDDHTVKSLNGYDLEHIIIHDRDFDESD